MPERDRLDAELADMQRRSDRLEGDIESTRRDWERKKQDPAVPGAAGDPDRAEEGPQPETNIMEKGGD